MSDFSDVIDRWAAPRQGHQCLLNTDDEDLAAWVLTRGGRGMASQCHFRYESHNICNRLGLETLEFPDAQEQQCSDIYWAWPKARAEATMLLDWLPRVLAPNGQLWLIGHNRSGIRAAPKALQAAGWSVHKMGSARHCVLLLATPPETSAGFDLEPYWASTELPHGQGRLWSLPGVFAHGRLDKGSFHLLPWLQNLPSPMLDFGCGAGLLCLAAGRSNTNLQITGIDNHWLAILSSERTAQENGLDLALCWSDGLTSIAAANRNAHHDNATRRQTPPATGKFACVVTNPPFHTGLKTDYDITHNLLRDIRQVLQPGGLLLAVVNDHLPYADWLAQYLKEPTCLAHAAGFKVWSARI